MPAGTTPRSCSTPTSCSSGSHSPKRKPPPSVGLSPTEQATPFEKWEGGSVGITGPTPRKTSSLQSRERDARDSARKGREAGTTQGGFRVHFWTRPINEARPTLGPSSPTLGTIESYIGASRVERGCDLVTSHGAGGSTRYGGGKIRVPKQALETDVRDCAAKLPSR